jgi:hypothetical protein
VVRNSLLILVPSVSLIVPAGDEIDHKLPVDWLSYGMHCPGIGHFQ